MDFTESEVSSYFTQRVPGLKQSGQREWRGKCPVHNGKDDNFAVDSRTGMSKCHSQCGKGWDILGLERELEGVDFIRAKESVYRIVGRAPDAFEDRDVEAAYDYTDESGKVVYQVVRKFGKKFAQRRPDGRGGWMWGLGDAMPVPFRLPRWKDAGFVGITEGEKDALTLESIGIDATCNNGGAGNFKAQLAIHFAGKKIAIFPDNDEPGRLHALKVAELLKPVAESVKIIELPDLPEKGDVSDFIRNGGTKQQLKSLYRKAQEWTPEWQFGSDVPDPNEKYVRTFAQYLQEHGGLDEFWRLPEIEGIHTPFPKLTQRLGGMRNGEVYVIGANQGMGKTSLGLQFAITAMKQRKGVLMFSMEMGHRHVFQRMVAIEARVDLYEFRTMRKDHPERWEMLQGLNVISNQLAQYPLYVSTKTGVTPEYLLSESQRLGKKHKVDLILVDHMQLMSSTGKQKSDYEKFTAISRAVKETAVEMNIPVILVSQTSRDNSHRGGDELNCSDLRGSGAIEEDAAGVMLLYYDKQDKADALTAGRFERGPVNAFLKLEKNRFGAGMVYQPLIHWKTLTRFDVMEDDAA